MVPIRLAIVGCGTVAEGFYAPALRGFQGHAHVLVRGHSHKALCRRFQRRRGDVTVELSWTRLLRNTARIVGTRGTLDVEVQEWSAFSAAKWAPHSDSRWGPEFWPGVHCSVLESLSASVVGGGKGNDSDSVIRAAHQSLMECIATCFCSA